MGQATIRAKVDVRGSQHACKKCVVFASHLHQLFGGPFGRKNYGLAAPKESTKRRLLPLASVSLSLLLAPLQAAWL